MTARPQSRSCVGASLGWTMMLLREEVDTEAYDVSATLCGGDLGRHFVERASVQPVGGQTIASGGARAKPGFVAEARQAAKIKGGSLAPLALRRTLWSAHPPVA